MKQLTSSTLTTDTEINLQPVLMMYELLICSVIKNNEVLKYTKQFTTYEFTANTEVNLPPVLIMCELLIHIIMNDNEA